MEEELTSIPQVKDIDDDEEDYDEGGDHVGKEIDITGDGGLKKKILELGSGWEKPAEGDEVEVHYVGTLESDGTQFDSSRDRDQPFTFKLGKGEVIAGWDKGIPTMKKGEKALVTCAPAYAYGEAGRLPTIPQNATLNFEIELIKWQKVNDISTERDNTLIKTILEEGSGWDKPEGRDEVLVSYKAYVKGVEQPFSQTGDEGVEFVLNEGLLCRAIPEAVKTMKKGESVKLEVQQQYGFGKEGGLQGKVPPDSELEIQLKLLSWKSVEDVTDNKKVWKKSIKEGDGYKKPKEGANVTAKYVCRMEGEQEIVDERDEFKFVVDEEQVQPAIIEQIVMKMKKGEVAQAFVPPEYGYGSDATGSTGKIIPDNMNLVFEISLIDFENPKESFEMDNIEKIVTAKDLKYKGNELYKQGKWKRAVKQYEKAIKLIEYDSSFKPEEQADAKEVRKSTHLNLAASLLKLEQWKDAVKNCDKVLEKESDNIKGLYRRAQAYLGTKDFVEAEIDINRALIVDPDNQDFKILQKRLKQMERIQNKKDAKIYGNIFAKMAQSKDQSAKVEKEGDVEMIDAQNVDQSNANGV